MSFEVATFEPVFALEYNGPIIADRMRNAVLMHQTWGAYNAVSCAYDGTCRVFAHRTLKAAIRSLASVCDSTKGRLNRRGDFAACIVLPDGHVANLLEARQMVASDREVA